MQLKKKIIGIEDIIKDTFIEYKLIIIWTAIITTLTHIYFFMRRFVNEDMRGFLFLSPDEPRSGRYFYLNLEIPHLPMVCFILTLLELTLASIFILKIFKIKDKVFSVIIVALMVTFPSWAYQFPYANMWDSYSLALLTAILAVYFTNRYKFGFLPGSIILACSLSIYQAYLAVAITLIMIILILSLLENDCKYFIKKALNFVLMSVIAVVLYKLGILILGIELSSYKGADTMGQIPINMIPELFVKTYKNFGLFFTGIHIFETEYERFFYVPFFMVIVYILDIILTIDIIYELMLNRKQIKIKNIILIVLLVLLLPLAVNFVDFVAWEAVASNLNTYSFVYVFVLPIILYLKLNQNNENKNFIHKRAVLILSSIIIFYNFWLTNVYYQKVDVITEYTKAFENRLLGRFEQLEGFTIDTKFAVITEDRFLYDELVHTVNNETFRYIKNDQGYYGFKVVGLRESNLMRSNQKTGVLMQNLIGVNLNTASVEEIEEIKKTEEYKSMGVYPANDSVKMINGVAVVNFVVEDK